MAENPPRSENPSDNQGAKANNSKTKTSREKAQGQAPDTIQPSPEDGRSAEKGLSVASGLQSQLRQLLTDLHLPTVRACYEEVAGQAQREQLSYERFLLELLRQEQEARYHHRIERLLRESHLPLEKTLESFEMNRLPLRLRQQVRSLLEGSFVDRRENLLAFGNPGSGKTHLLCGISQHLVRAGRKMLYTTSALLVQELLIAKRDLTLSRVLRRLGNYEILLIDDLGYVQQSQEEMEVLFTLLAERYERGSVLITSNLPFSRWESIFKDPMTTAAAIDRLVHHSVILELNLPSYRMEEAKQARKSGTSEDEGHRQA
jgi:DNA replication protein DnaC